MRCMALVGKFQAHRNISFACVVEAAPRVHVSSSKKAVGIWEFRSMLSPFEKIA